MFKYCIIIFHNWIKIFQNWIIILFAKLLVPCMPFLYNHTIIQIRKKTYERGILRTRGFQKTQVGSYDRKVCGDGLEPHKDRHSWWVLLVCFNHSISFKYLGLLLFIREFLMYKLQNVASPVQNTTNHLYREVGKLLNWYECLLSI